MYAGLVQLEATMRGVFLTRDASQVPKDADALPAFRVYGPDGFLVAGTCAFLESGAVTGATNASPIVVTSAGHGLTDGARVTVSGVAGNTAANGTWVVAVVDADTFTLLGSAGNGAYVSGGSWHPAGAYAWSVDCLGADGFEAGENYQVVASYAVAGSRRGDGDSFTVV